MGTIEFDLNVFREMTLNKFIAANNRNRFIANKMKKEGTHYAKMIVERAMNMGLRFDWPGKLVFEWTLPDQRIDPDNWAFCQKYILDGMQKAKFRQEVFLTNDNVKNIRCLEHKYRIDRNNPKLVVWFEKVG